MFLLGMFTFGITVKGQTPTYKLTISNETMVNASTYQFDVYLQRTGSTELQLANVACGIAYDASILNGGTPTCSQVSGYSQLSAAQQPNTTSTTMTGTISYTVGNVTYRYLNITARANPGAGFGTIISATGDCPTPGTRIGRFQISNTVAFTESSTAKHIFSTAAGSGKTNTVVSAYVNGTATAITSASSNLAYNASGACNSNVVINGCGVSASVSTTAALCFGVSNGSATITLSGIGTSSTGSYSVDGGASVSYSSNPFTVSGLSAGSHSVSITSGTCSASTGSFTIGGPSAGLSSSFAATSCDSYSLPWGGSATSSGSYSHTYASALGCDSVVTANITINNSASTSFEATACDSYTLPWGGVATSTGAYTHTYSTVNSCDSVVTANVTINNSTSSSQNVSGCSSYVLPWGTTVTASGPYSYTYSTVNACDSVVTYNVTIKLPTASTTNLAICSGSLPYSWNGQSLTTGGTYTATLTNAAGCDSIATLNLTISGGTPAQPAATAVSQTLVSNACGARVYRYAVTAITNASGYAWSFTGLGTTGVVDSGDATSSRVIVVRYTSNAAAATGDSVRVRAYSGCGTSLNRAAKLINTVLTVPAAPASVTITPVTTNVCGNRVYTYSAPALVAAGATTAAATGWLWSFTGLGTTAQIIAGDLNDQSITVSYTSNAAAGTGDSVRVAYTSGCGNSLNKSSKLTNTAITVPAAPASITVTAVSSNVCGARVYTYAAPALPAATATAGAATGWLWSFTGTLGANAQIIAGDVNSQTITVSYSSNAAAATGDSVRVRYTSDCGSSLNKASKLTNTVLTVPAAPASVTATSITTNVCGNRVYRYTAPVLPAAAATTAAPTGYVWSFTGLGTTASIDSGNVNSRVIVVSYTSNAAAATGDSVKVAYTSSCGNSLAKALKLTNTALTVPVAPASIVATSITTNVCGNRVYRYTAPVLPAATATAGAATGYVWSFKGLGTTGVIDSGDVNSRIIVVRYTSNAAAATGDSVRVLYTSGCGNSLNRALKLTNAAITTPAAPASITITPVTITVCGNRVYRYAAPALVGATATAGAATGWLWSFTGTLGANAVIDSGDANSQVIRVKFTSNAAAATGDSVRVRYTSGCGNGLNKASKLSNTALANCPVVPANLPVTKVAPVRTDMNVKVYPNPTTNNFNVQVLSAGTEQSVVRVMDLQGRVLKTMNVSANETVNLGSDLRAGAYIVEVRQGNSVKTTRVLKF